MTLSKDDLELLEDLRRFIADAQRAEAALIEGRLPDARDVIAFVSGQALGLAMRVGVKFDQAVQEAAKGKERP